MAARAALALAVGTAGVWIALLAFGRSTERVGPFEVELFSRPGAGRSEISLPPLGRIEADTHLAPLDISATLEVIDPDRTGDIIRRRGVRSLVTLVEAGTGSALRSHALRSSAVALAGALVVASLVHRRDWAAVRRAVAGGGAALAVLGLGTYLTYTPGAFAEARYTGSVRAAVDLVGPITLAGQRFEAFRDDIDGLVRGAARAYGVLSAEGPSERATAILHISDVHSSPLGMDFAQRLAEEFEVDAVVDTGDLTTFSTAVETTIVNRIAGFPVPYLFVRGNHDSFGVGAQVEGLPNAETLEHEAATVEGIRFFGAPHPLFTGDPDAEGDAEVAAAVADAAEDLTAAVAAEDVPPDVLLVHDGRMADPVIGEVPLVLSGHYHRFAAATQRGSIRLRTASTGAGGLDAFTQEEPVVLGAQILYLEGSPPRVAAVDRVTLDPITRDVVVRRDLLEPDEIPEPAPSR